MAEWSNAAVLKTVDLNGSGGSNPSLSANKLKLSALRWAFFVHVRQELAPVRTCTKKAQKAVRPLSFNLFRYAPPQAVREQSSSAVTARIAKFCFIVFLPLSFSMQYPTVVFPAKAKCGTAKSAKKERREARAFLWEIFPYFAALAALNASMSIGVTLNRSPQMP